MPIMIHASTDAPPRAGEDLEDTLTTSLVDRLDLSLFEVGQDSHVKRPVKTAAFRPKVPVKEDPKAKRKISVEVHRVRLSHRDRRAIKVNDAIREAVKGVVHSLGRQSGARLALVDPAVLRIAGAVERALPVTRERASAATIEKLVEALVETHDPLAKVTSRIDAANAKARVEFIEKVPTLSAEDVTTASGSTARNRSQTASRWKAEGKVFSIPWRGSERYPAFQFKDGRPRPVVARVLSALPHQMSPWETAYWFVSTNSWLGDLAPVDCLDEVEKVVAAARQESETVAG